jgi:hypothetical protein
VAHCGFSIQLAGWRAATKKMRRGMVSPTRKGNKGEKNDNSNEN